MMALEQVFLISTYRLIVAEPKFCVYIITNLETGKYYIGITKCGLAKRWRGHKSAAKHGTGRLQTSIRKHGPEKFKIEPLVYADSKKEMEELEKLCIWASQSFKRSLGYNITLGGENPSITEETRLKLSKITTERMKSQELRKRCGDSNRGKKLSDEQKEKLKASRAGKHHTLESRAKISAAKKGKPNVGWRMPSAEECKARGERMRIIRSAKYWSNKSPNTSNQGKLYSELGRAS